MTTILRRKPISESCYFPNDDVFAEMRRLREGGLNNRQVAAAVGVLEQVAQISLQAYFEPIPDTPPERDMDDPTPEQIRAACREIQSEWSPRERAKRAGSTLARITSWSPPAATLHGAPLRKDDAA